MHKISPSQIDTWFKCPTEWRWQYVEAIKLDREVTQVYFEKGSYTHRLLHIYYQLIQSGQKAGTDFTFNAMMKQLNNDLDSLTPENVLILAPVRKIIVRYLGRQTGIIDQDISILGVEKQLELEVTTPKGNTVLLNGILDLAYMDSRRKIHIRDHKTGAKPYAWQSRNMDLEFQLFFYAVVWWKLTNQMPDVVEVNYLSTADNAEKKPFSDQFKLLHKTLNETMLNNFWDHLMNVIDAMLTGETLHRYGPHCGGCQYTNLCQLELNGLSTERTKAKLYRPTGRDYVVNLPGSVTPAETQVELTERRAPVDFSIEIDFPDL